MVDWTPFHTQDKCNDGLPTWTSLFHTPSANDSFSFSRLFIPIIVIYYLWPLVNSPDVIHNGSVRLCVCCDVRWWYWQSFTYGSRYLAIKDSPTWMFQFFIRENFVWPCTEWNNMRSPKYIQRSDCVCVSLSQSQRLQIDRSKPKIISPFPISWVVDLLFKHSFRALSYVSPSNRVKKWSSPSKETNANWICVIKWWKSVDKE